MNRDTHLTKSAEQIGWRVDAEQVHCPPSLPPPPSPFFLFVGVAYFVFADICRSAVCLPARCVCAYVLARAVAGSSWIWRHTRSTFSIFSLALSRASPGMRCVLLRVLYLSSLLCSLLFFASLLLSFYLPGLFCRLPSYLAIPLSSVYLCISSFLCLSICLSSCLR